VEYQTGKNSEGKEVAVNITAEGRVPIDGRVRTEKQGKKRKQMTKEGGSVSKKRKMDAGTEEVEVVKPVIPEGKNPISIFYEFSNSCSPKKTPSIKLVNQNSSNRNSSSQSDFTFEARLDDVPIAQGRAKTKKDAKTYAAWFALQALEKESAVYKQEIQRIKKGIPSVKKQMRNFTKKKWRPNPMKSTISKTTFSRATTSTNNTILYNNHTGAAIVVPTLAAAAAAANRDKSLQSTTISLTTYNNNNNNPSTNNNPSAYNPNQNIQTHQQHSAKSHQPTYPAYDTYKQTMQMTATPQYGNPTTAASNIYINTASQPQASPWGSQNTYVAQAQNPTPNFNNYAASASATQQYVQSAAQSYQQQQQQVQQQQAVQYQAAAAQYVPTATTQLQPAQHQFYYQQR